MNHRNWQRFLTVLVGGLFLAACSETGITGMDEEGSSFSAAHTVAEGDQICETADFDGYAHGDAIDPLEIDFGSGIGTLSFDLAVTPGSSVNNPPAEATAFDVDVEHPDDDDLNTPAANGICSDCEGHGRILIIADGDFASEGDIDSPMELAITRDDGMEFLIKQVDMFDQESAQNEGMELLRDGTVVIDLASSISGDGEVAEDVEVSDATTFGTDWVFDFTGSGGVDNLLVCVEEPDEPGGGEGCTPGYWRQPHHFDDWTDHSPGDDLTSVFTIPGDLELARPERDDPEDISLLDAVTLRGGGVNALLRHAVAALLNAANPDVSYDLTESDVIDMVNDALAGEGDFSIEELKDELETFNEQGCPL